jgi:hypothetical protein
VSELKDTRKTHAIFSDCANFVDFGVNRALARLDGYDPDRKSERVAAQKGVFTFCEKLLVDHAIVIGEALLAGAGTEKNLPLLKIVVSPEAKRFFRQYLNKLNVTAVTLFPGKDGLGRTVAEVLMVQKETFSGE